MTESNAPAPYDRTSSDLGAALLRSQPMSLSMPEGTLEGAQIVNIMPPPAFVPSVGQTFDNFQQIEELLDAFGHANNFMIIIMRSQRPAGRVIQATFGCYKSGSYRPNKMDSPKKRTVKTNCPFQINVRFSDKSGLYRITKVELEHNHELDFFDAKTSIMRKNSIKKKLNIEDHEIPSRYVDIGEHAADNAVIMENTPTRDFPESKTKRIRRSKKATTAYLESDRVPSNQSSNDSSAELHDEEYDEANELNDQLLLDENVIHGGHHDFDLLSGLELPDEIAREVSAAMRYHINSNSSSSNNNNNSNNV